jgi:hypothetical protein
MYYLLAGLAGVVVGASLAWLIMLFVLQRRSDRDLIERRIRACSEYLDCLGDLDGACGRGGDDPEILDQAWWNAKSFCREFHLSSWILPTHARESLGRVVKDLEEEERAYRANGAGASGRVAQILCERYHEVLRIVRGELTAQERAFRAFRFFPEFAGKKPMDRES